MVAGVFAERQQFATVGTPAITGKWFSPGLVSQSKLGTSTGGKTRADQAPSSWWISSSHLRNLSRPVTTLFLSNFKRATEWTWHSSESGNIRGFQINRTSILYQWGSMNLLTLWSHGRTLVTVSSIMCLPYLLLCNRKVNKTLKPKHFKYSFFPPPPPLKKYKGCCSFSSSLSNTEFLE